MARHQMVEQFLHMVETPQFLVGYSVEPDAAIVKWLVNLACSSWVIVTDGTRLQRLPSFHAHLSSLLDGETLANLL